MPKLSAQLANIKQIFCNLHEILDQQDTIVLKLIQQEKLFAQQDPIEYQVSLQLLHVQLEHIIQEKEHKV